MNSGLDRLIIVKRKIFINDKEICVGFLKWSKNLIFVP